MKKYSFCRITILIVKSTCLPLASASQHIQTLSVNRPAHAPATSSFQNLNDAFLKMQQEEQQAYINTLRQENNCEQIEQQLQQIKKEIATLSRIKKFSDNGSIHEDQLKALHYKKNTYEQQLAEIDQKGQQKYPCLGIIETLASIQQGQHLVLQNFNKTLEEVIEEIKQEEEEVNIEQQVQQEISIEKGQQLMPQKTKEIVEEQVVEEEEILEKKPTVKTSNRRPELRIKQRRKNSIDRKKEEKRIRALLSSSNNHRKKTPAKTPKEDTSGGIISWVTYPYNYLASCLQGDGQAIRGLGNHYLDELNIFRQELDKKIKKTDLIYENYQASEQEFHALDSEVDQITDLLVQYRKLFGEVLQKDLLGPQAELTVRKRIELYKSRRAQYKKKLENFSELKK